MWNSNTIAIVDRMGNKIENLGCLAHSFGAEVTRPLDLYQKLLEIRQKLLSSMDLCYLAARLVNTLYK